MRYAKSLIAVTLAALALPLTACDTFNRDDDDNSFSEPASMNLTVSRNEIVAGETVTVSATTNNLAGRDIEFQWSAPGGEVVGTEEGSRVARVRFDNAGSYTITGRVRADNDAIIITDSVTVNVRPLRPGSQQPMQKNDND